MKENSKFWLGIGLTVLVNAVMISFSYGVLSNRVGAMERGLEGINKKIEKIYQLSERITTIEAKYGIK